jgi:histidine triad (HIT) family protein
MTGVTRGVRLSPVPARSKECFICAKHRGEFPIPGGPVYADALFFASHVLLRSEEAYLGWFVVEPRRHVAEWGDLTTTEAATLGGLIARLSRAIKESAGAEKVYVFVLGDEVPHLHIHLIPRFPGTPVEYWGSRVDEWPGAPRGGPAEVERAAERLREALRKARDD